MRFFIAAIPIIIVLGGCSPDEQSAESSIVAGPSPGVTSDSPEHQTGEPVSHAQTSSSHSDLSRTGYDITPLPPERVKELASRLDPEAYRITQKEGTERAFCGTLLDNKKDGTYVCIVCGLPLFSSEHKFDSGTGWPSFYREFDPEHVARHEDRAYGMVRTEIECARCGAHLGHVFDDGPRPTGERHCLNSTSLKFYERGEELPR